MLTRFMYGSHEKVEEARRKDKNIVPANCYFNKETGTLILSIGSELEEPNVWENSFLNYIERETKVDFKI